MLLTRKTMWMKFLALLLICGLVTCCFAGCQNEVPVKLEKRTIKVKGTTENFRDGLIAHEWNGLTYYLPDDMEKRFEVVDSISFENEANTSRVNVKGGWINEATNQPEYSVEDLQDDFIESNPSISEMETGNKNGVNYVYCTERNGTKIVSGFYYKNGYGWRIEVLFTYDNQLADAIDYATLGEIKYVPTPPSADEDDEIDNPSLPPAVDDPACDPDSITLSVWTPDLDQGEGSWLENRLAAFEEAHPEYEITWEIGICSEGDVGTVVRADPSAAADVYFYASSQLGALYAAGALAKLGGTYREQVLNDNSETFVNTVTYIDGSVYGFPITNETWFMYYNKDTYTAEDIKSMDSLLEKGTVSMQMGTAWYTACFFTANGCTLFGPGGNDASAGIQFGGDKGYAAARAMIDLANNPNFKDDANGSGVAGMIDGSVDAMFSGSWDYSYLYEYMGDKLGCAPLPTITIAGQQKQMMAFAGSKAVGVNPHCENQKEAMQLAAFLASEESQLLRFQMRRVTPAHKNLAGHPSIMSSEFAVAEMAIMEYCSVAQPFIPEMGNFWGPMGTFGGAVVNGDVNYDNYKDQVDLLNGQLNRGYL